VRRAYTIGYAPASDAPGFHRVRVRVVAPDGRSLTARTRRGYVAAPAGGDAGHDG
jgi:hypothetical protein